MRGLVLVILFIINKNWVRFNKLYFQKNLVFFHWNYYKERLLNQQQFFIKQLIENVVNSMTLLKKKKSGKSSKLLEKGI